MTPWQKAEFQLEEQLETIINIVDKNPNTEAQEIGSCILTLVSLCQDIETMNTDEEKNLFWDTIKEDIDEIISDTQDFLKKLM